VPRWGFDDATLSKSASSFDNADHVDVVIHNYRWRLGVAAGESGYDDLERQLATGPTIPVPTITVEGDANVAPHPDPSAYATSSQARTSNRSSPGRRTTGPKSAPPVRQKPIDADQFSS
jgi:hypothetical protein